MSNVVKAPVKQKKKKKFWGFWVPTVTFMILNSKEKLLVVIPDGIRGVVFGKRNKDDILSSANDEQEMEPSNGAYRSRPHDDRRHDIHAPQRNGANLPKVLIRLLENVVIPQEPDCSVVQDGLSGLRRLRTVCPSVTVIHGCLPPSNMLSGDRIAFTDK
ncbi:hypothetical protein Baya_15324 [Bagarius yarrelli]|uniref:Uncharacterized protein n=1 Tax=Bagarius yarrelli TaxID=175774 RepID=A0A556VBE5_BAGYA|nr:hypothetical protein Baya_15324 [Bagarius yarrelli]